MLFRKQLAQAISELEPEYRAVVADSLRHSDGTPQSFEMELTAAQWEHPHLPVRQILQQIMVDQ